MATTSLWHIKGSLKDLIAYVENPAKTNDPSLQDFFNVFSYAQNPDKTEQGEFVTAINCVKEIALEQMILTKKQFCKDDGYIAWHGYQSFKPGEVTAEQCHAIGIQTARELWGNDFQIIVTTHLDKDHLHNHFCFNSVGFRDGRKYNYSKAERQRMMEISDRICMEHGLSIIANPKKAPSRPVWEDERAGKPTRYNIYREDLRNAANGSRTIEQMICYLERLGYDVDFTGTKWKIKLHRYKYYTYLETLNPQWTPEYTRTHLGSRASFGIRRAEVFLSPYLPEELRDVWQQGKRTTEVYKLYIFWQYQLGILPKGTRFKPMSPYMKEEIRKMDSLVEQMKYLHVNNIKTLADLLEDLDTTERKLAEQIQVRTKLQNKMRRADPVKKEEYRKEKEQVTQVITALRKRRKLDLAVEERSLRIDNIMEQIVANEEKHRQQKQYTRPNYERSYER